MIRFVPGERVHHRFDIFIAYIILAQYGWRLLFLMNQSYVFLRLLIGLTSGHHRYELTLRGTHCLVYDLEFKKF